MAGFDKNLDKELFSKQIELEKGRITIAVFSYNEGAPKLQITRENRTASGEFSFAKLGRLTKEEVESVVPAIEAARKFL